MTKKQIRLQYSGFVMFGTKMLSVVTGMIYTILITRATTTGEYGIWANVWDLMAYFILLASALPFWAGRFVAREKEGAVKTGVIANLIIALISVGIYLSMVSFITSALNVSRYLILYLVTSALIVELYLLYALEAGLRAEKPQALGYGLGIEEICKIVFAYILIAMLKEPLLGAMTSYMIAVAIQILYYIKLFTEEFKQRIHWKYVREWLKGSTVNIYNLIGTQIAAIIYMLLFVLGGAEARGNYTAASTIASIISYAIFLSIALYPKLLAKDSPEDVTTSLKMVLMVAIPMTLGALTIPNSLLIILDPKYAEAAPILYLLAIATLIATISQFFIWVLLGVERVDEKAEISLKELSKSSIFKIFTLPYIQATVTLPIAYVVLSYFASNQPIQAGIYVAVIYTAAQFAIFAVLWFLLCKKVKIIIPWINILKYIFASAIMALILYVIPPSTRLLTTLGIVIMGTIIYFALLMVIDKEARALINLIWQEIKSILRIVVP